MAKTKTPIKAFLINPEKREITEVEHNGDYKQIYDLIQCRPSPFCAVYLDDGDTVFVDDEGLLKDGVEFFFTLGGYPQPLANRGLVLGTDAQGDSAAPKITIDALRKMVGWKRLTVLGFNTWEGTSEMFGKPCPVIGSTPVFAELPDDRQIEPYRPPPDGRPVTKFNVRAGGGMLLRSFAVADYADERAAYEAAAIEALKVGAKVYTAF